MQEIRQAATDLFFLLGERIALLIILFLAIIFFSIQSTKAFSQSESPQNSDSSESIAAEGKPPSVTYTPTPTPSPTPTPTPSPTPTPTPTPIPVDPNDNSIWDRLADCETHKNWNEDTGNGYFGGLQFTQGAWNSVGGAGNPAQASRDEQIMRGKMLQSGRGFAPWNECARRLGLY